MLNEVERSKELKGRSLEAKVAIVIFLASRHVGRPRKIEEIQRYARTSSQEISKCYNKLMNTIFRGMHPRVKPSDIAQQACTKMRLK